MVNFAAEGVTTVEEKENRKKHIGFWVLSGILTAMGLFLRFAVVGYSFSSLVCFGMLALTVCYKVLSLLARKYRNVAKALRLVLDICVGLGVSVVSLTLLVICKESVGAAQMPCEYVVVLGAGVHGTVPSLSLRNRLDAAAVYLKENPDVICVVSGGQGPGEDISEAQCMFEDLVANGVDPERIWMEDRSTSTEENLRFSLDLIESKTGVRPGEIGVLSSEYHLLRAGMMGDKVGVEVYGVPARTSRFSMRINYFLREVAGVWHEILLGG